jgi:capsular exopolysaccharide synthesis family protein
MSHIYDALNKSRGGEPPRTGGPGEPGPPGPPPAQRPPAQGEEPPRRFEPADRLEVGLLGEPNHELLRELDSLRSSVEVALGRGPHKVIGLTGARAGEGASTVALHFACLLSRVVERRTLLVDADMTRSGVGLSDVAGNREGLSELLVRDLQPEKMILATGDPNLHFLPSGQDRVHHATGIGSGLLRPLFDALGRYYDAVVVDIAPVLEHPEAPYIGAACDGVVLVVRAHQTRRELAQRALGELNFARCRILGTVLNGSKGNLPGFLREGA